MTEQQVASVTPVAGLPRRLGALISDSLVMIGIMLLGTLPFLPLLAELNAKAMVPSEVGWAWTAAYWLWLLLLWSCFLGYFWSHGGQTIGMRAWRLRLESEIGKRVTLKQVLLRLWGSIAPWLPGMAVLAISELNHSSGLKYLGQGLLLLGTSGWFLLCSSQKLTWHDRLSQTQIILLSKP